MSINLSKTPAQKMAEAQEEMQNLSHLKIKMARWLEMSKQLKALRAAEAELRKEIFGEVVPMPKEGTNKAAGDGFSLSVKYPITRKVDESMMKVALSQMDDDKRLLVETTIIRHKPELNVRDYKKLDPETRRMVDQFIISKPGSPTDMVIEFDE
jgi:hypothetical protein